MRIIILDLAEADLADGFHFYEKREAGLGEYFLTNLFADIDSLKIFAGIHRITHRNFHRLLSKRFPFAIYYTWDRDTVRIHSVVDCRRNPTWIHKHLDQA